MGIFRQFPYTNFHDLNVDWIMHTIKQLADDYEKLNGLFKDFEELKQYVEDYFNNADFLDDIEMILFQMVQDGIIDLANVNLKAPKEILGNNIIERFNFDRHDMQGACWYEDNKFIMCVGGSGVNTCNLICVDADDGSEVWNYELQLYHANSICYRPIDHCLYIAACYDVNSPENLLDQVIVVDARNPSTILNTIHVPARGGIYSVAYDSTTDTFYSTNYRGTTDDEANILFEYNGIFASVKREIKLLDDLTVACPAGHSGQGVQLVHNGVAWIVYYEPTRAILGFDVKTGEKVAAFNVAPVFNGYSEVGELQNLTCKPSTEQFYLGYNSPYNNNGRLGMRRANIAEVPIIRSVTSVMMGRENTSQPTPYVDCPMDYSRSSYLPNYAFRTFSTFNDVVTYCKTLDKVGYVHVMPNTDNDYEIYRPICDNVKLVFTRISADDTSLRHLIRGGAYRGAEIIFEYCDFTATPPTLSDGVYICPDNRYDQSIKSLIVVAQFSNVMFFDCTFEDVVQTTPGAPDMDYAVLATLDSKVVLMGNTVFNNTLYPDVFVLNGASFSDRTAATFFAARDTTVRIGASGYAETPVQFYRNVAMELDTEYDLTSLSLFASPSIFSAASKLVMVVNDGSAYQILEAVARPDATSYVRMYHTATDSTIQFVINPTTKKIKFEEVRGSGPAELNVTAMYQSQ